MNKRTQSIIAICKGTTRYNYEGCNLADAIANYLSDVCKVASSFYTHTRLAKIMKECFYDFLDTCDKPSLYLNELDHLYGDYISPTSYIEAVGAVFAVVQVQTDSSYMNGFSVNYDEIVKELNY